MNTYTCPTCGEKMERDLSLFIDHTEKHIVDELKKQNPAWITQEGFCPKCLDYYQKARRGEATNLDEAGTRQRWMLALSGLGATVALYAWLEASAAPPPARLALFIPIFLGLLGFFQARKRFCVVIAQGQHEAMRKKAHRMLLHVLLYSIALTALALFFMSSAASAEVEGTGAAEETAQENPFVDQLGQTEIGQTEIGQAASAPAFPSRDFRDAHDSMTSQKKNIAAIQNGFLMRDADAVESGASALARGMLAVSRTLPDQATAQEGAWMTMYQIVAEAQQVKEKIAADDFDGAYEHYSAMVGQCVKCHQLTRD